MHSGEAEVIYGSLGNRVGVFFFAALVFWLPWLSVGKLTAAHVALCVAVCVLVCAPATVAVVRMSFARVQIFADRVVVRYAWTRREVVRAEIEQVLDLGFSAAPAPLRLLMRDGTVIKLPVAFTSWTREPLGDALNVPVRIA